jgi:hypothetical protein
MTPILEKIQKLLRLSKCSKATPNEAAVALAKAMKLAADNGIDLDKISTDEVDSQVTHRTTGAVFGVAERNASALVKRHFNVGALFSKRSGKAVIHFIGYPETCDLAIYVFVYLVRCARSAWKNRPNKRLRNRESFIFGFFLAIDRLMPPKFHQPGLVPSFEAYTENILLKGSRMITKSIAPKSTPIKSLAAGFRAGESNGINAPLRGSDTLNLEG